LKTYPGSGVAVFFGPWGQQSQRTPLTEITNLKELKSFIEFPLGGGAY
jgi:hypothetical protein